MRFEGKNTASEAIVFENFAARHVTNRRRWCSEVKIKEIKRLFPIKYSSVDIQKQGLCPAGKAGWVNGCLAWKKKNVKTEKKVWLKNNKVILLAEAKRHITSFT